MSPPRPPHRPVGAQPYGLASTMLRVTATEMADAGRSMRARRLQDSRSVLSVDVEPGIIRGRVQGSDPVPYAVRWQCRPFAAASEVIRRELPAGDPGRVSRLVPTARDLTATCDCPDDARACKHALAVLLEVADDIGHDARSLAVLRGVPLAATDPVDPADPHLDHDARPPVVTTMASRRAPVTPVVDPLAADLGFPPGTRLTVGRPAILATEPPVPRGPDDIARVLLTDALYWMQAASPW